MGQRIARHQKVEEMLEPVIYKAKTIRYCKCGTKLSIYNPRRKCYGCQTYVMPVHNDGTSNWRSKQSYYLK